VVHAQLLRSSSHLSHAHPKSLRKNVSTPTVTIINQNRPSEIVRFIFICFSPFSIYVASPRSNLSSVSAISNHDHVDKRTFLTWRLNRATFLEVVASAGGRDRIRAFLWPCPLTLPCVGTFDSSLRTSHCTVVKYARVRAKSPFAAVYQSSYTIYRRAPPFFRYKLFCLFDRFFSSNALSCYFPNTCSDTIFRCSPSECMLLRRTCTEFSPRTGRIVQDILCITLIPMCIHSVSQAPLGCRVLASFGEFPERFRASE